MSLRKLPGRSAASAIANQHPNDRRRFRSDIGLRHRCVQPSKANESLLFDARGNIQGRTVDGVLSTYRYDRIDRLNQETGLASQSFGLDANANRTSDGTATYTVLPNGNRLATRNGVTLTYDADGNLLSDQAVLGGSTVTRSYTYTLAGQLKTVSVNGVLRATYTYNHLNQRTRKVLANPAPGTPATTLRHHADFRGGEGPLVAGWKTIPQH